MSAIAHRLPREMAILSVMDSVLSFAVICMVTLAAKTGLPASVPNGSATAQGIVLAFCLTVILTAIALTAGVYKPQSTRIQGRLFSIGFAAALACGMILFFAYAELASPEGEKLALAARLLAGWGVAIATARAIHAVTLRRRCLTRHILLFGDASQVGALQGSLSGIEGYRFESPHSFHDWSWKALKKSRVWGVMMASSADAANALQLLDSKMRGIRVWSFATFQEKYLGRIDLDALSINHLLDGSYQAQGPIAAVLKRGLDLTLGVALLLVAWPVMLAAAVVIRMDSAGPALYMQTRIGQFGRPFTVLKFRSMRIDAEACGTPRWAQQHDPRVTRVGRFIRTTRIDELPQLFNVLRGDMSLVGPRPERPHFVDQLTRAIPFYQQRHYAKPGLTGWAQVNYPYGASVEDARQKLAYDLYYIKNGSLLLDLAILCDTVRVVLNGAGAR